MPVVDCVSDPVLYIISKMNLFPSFYIPHTSESKVEVLDYTVNRSETSPVVVRRRPRPDVQKKKLYRTSSSRQLEALCLEDEFRGRLSSDASARSSGYWSIRYSDARLSQVSIPESVDEEDESNEESPSNLVKELQSTAIEEDEGVMDINRTEWSDMEPMHRPRAIQVSKTCQSNRKHNKVKCSDHSQTLPYSSSSVQGAVTASSCTNLDSMSSSDSSSSSSSLDSDDTLISLSAENGELVFCVYVVHLYVAYIIYIQLEL